MRFKTGSSYLETVAGQRRKRVVALKLCKGFCDRGSEVNRVESVVVFVKEEAGCVCNAERSAAGPAHTETWVPIPIDWHGESIKSGGRGASEVCSCDGEDGMRW
jgi:hypothetical protein